MANISYSALIDEVLPHLAADPSDPVTENAIKRACIEFCKDSWIWRYLPDPQDVVAGTAEYDLDKPAGSDIVTVIDAQVNNVPVLPKGIEWLNKTIPGWRTTPAEVKYFTQVDTNQMILAPLPPSNITNGLTMTVALQPTQNATGMPDWIVNQYIYQLVDGALAKLMLMPNKPWTDLNTGNYHRDRFDKACADARESAVSALGRAPIRTSYQH